MKHVIALLAATALAVSAFAGETNAPSAAKVQTTTKEAKNWWTDFSITPFGALNHANLTDRPVWGAGLDVGYNVNHYVSLHVANLAYESHRVERERAGSDKDKKGGSFTKDLHDWGGPTIDETSILLRADLIRDSKERFVAYGVGGLDRQWDRDDWGFSAGIGAEVRLAKNVSVGVDSRIRAWFHDEKDLLTRGFLSFRF